MRKLQLTSNCNAVRHSGLIPFTVIFLLLVFGSFNISYSQCIPLDGTIQGNVHLDEDYDGVKGVDENGIANIMILAYDSFGTLVSQGITGDDGNYLLDGLIDGNNYRLEFDYPQGYFPSISSGNNKTSIQFASSPSCEKDLALQKPSEYCALDPKIALTCFVQGNLGENDLLETLISLTADFDESSSVTKNAMKAETGSVWGITYKKKTKELFTSAFVKQYASLTEHGLGAIFKTDMSDGVGVTSLFADLVDLGVDLGTLVTSDVNDCTYGEMVGKAGLGSLEIASDESVLYTVNLHENKLISIPTIAPNEDNIQQIQIPDPGCSDGEYRAFALKYYNEKIYVGLTCTAETSEDQSESTIVVFEFDPEDESFVEIFSTNYIKGFWSDYPSNTQLTSHWLTDLDFTDEGNMILSLSDRIGHRFCNNTTGRLDVQNPDILLAWNNNGVWTLEDNGSASFYSGTGVGNGQGPGGGEFFGDDFWPHNPELHPETALGSVFSMPGTGEVIATVYDPITNSYSGGLHKYMTGSGTKVGAIELYTHSVDPQFGKATGFGDIIPMCESLPVEIGNYVWLDNDNDGIQDPGENPLANISISLFDDNCTLIANTITDENGNYYFNNSNVDLDGDGEMDELEYGSQYYIVIDDPAFDKDMSSLVINEENHLLSQLNIGMGAHKDLNDMDAELATGICDLIDGYPTISIITQGSGENNHSFDLGFYVPDNFDLALRKTVDNPTPVQYGEVVNFTIEVFNQGNVGAKNIQITDYLPIGFEFDEALNPGWKESGDNAEYTITSTLNPGSKETITINLTVVQGAQANQLINYAEISGSQDQFGNIPVDSDSSPDLEKGNDIGGDPFGITDDEINDDGTIDEDDHDPAVVDVFDLALRKTIDDPQDFYMSGDEVLFNIDVFNQGNMPAKNIDVVDYLPDGLDVVDSPINANWEIVSDNLYRTTIENEIFPGSSSQIQILLRVKEDVQQDQLVNKSEISAAEDKNGNAPLDIDSNPNLDDSDDIGGNVHDFTNNEINDDGTIDEDDHDPEMVQIHFYDLALMKTTNSSRVKPGDEVSFDIYVINQGSLYADQITVVDYLPETLDLIDNNWQVDPSDPSGQSVTRMLSVENGLIPEGGLAPGEEVIVSITVVINELAQTGMITNYAEITSAFDINGHDMSNDDSDSSPDMVKINDNGGVPFSSTDNEVNDNGELDEDDHDPAGLFIAPAIESPCSCLDNASTPDDGQFSSVITVLSLSGENWTVDQATDLYDISSPAPPNAPIPLAPGTPLVENVIGAGISEYTITAIHIDGQGYSASFVNAAGAVDQLVSAGCSYLNSNVIGANGACIGSTQFYSVENPDPANVYNWSLASGGSINGPSTGTTIEVNWGNTYGVPYNLVLEESGPDTCYAPVFFVVTLGTDAGALACHGSINMSLDADCSLLVTPEMLLTQGLDPNAFYNVMVKDEDDNLIPNATLTGDHIGGVFYGKAIDMCGNNSCWSTITIEDKMPPQIACSDTIIPCHLMDFYEGPVIIDNCDPNPIMTLTNELINAFTCDDNYVKEVVRTYIAEDQYGNVSGECSQSILVERIDLNDVVYPPNFRISDGNPLQCDVMLEDGVPPIAITGVPSIDGKPLFPNTDIYCNVGVTYTDIQLPPVGCVRKIMRRWMVYEAWCSSGPYEIIPQFIEIIDDTPPVISCPEDITMTTNGFTCEATVVLPAADISDNCSEDLGVDIAYPGGFFNDSNGGVITLPAGEHEVIYTVYDECLNSSSCVLNVTIEDVTSPIAVCDQHTVVALRSDGYANAYAHVFDDGSFDDCAIDFMEVKRMDNGEPCGHNNDFREYIEFCCADAGRTVMVQMRVWDVAGNYNECMVEVLVQDKFPPEIICPDNVTLECATEIDLDNLEIFGSATAIDQCGASISENVSSFFDQCGEGYVYRDFTASDANGSSSCRQIINLVNSDPFDINDIVWPLDLETDAGCNAGDLIPDNLPAPYNAPVIYDDFCDLVGVSYEDLVFPFESENNSCLKIIRKWSVIDWCDFADGQYEIYVHDQIIKVTNSVAPEITSNCDPISVCSFEDNCESGPITLIATATDDCTPDNALTWEYEIDFNNDGSREIYQSGFGPSINASGDYPIGNHSIFWTFEDRCGNKTTCQQLFAIVNCKTPTAACIEGLAISLLGMDLDGDGELDMEMACIYAEQFDASSFHPCGYDLTFSFSSDTTDIERCFDCFDIGLNDIEIWVTDIFGNQDYCLTTIDVQDNNDVNICDDPKDCITWPEETIFIDDCNASTDPEDLGSEPTVDVDCLCDDYTITFVDSDVSDPDNSCQTIERVWTVTFNCFTDLSCDFTQTLELSNVAAPELICFGGDVTGSSDEGNCEAFVTVPAPTFDPSCNTGITITHNSPFGISDEDASGVYPVGATIVTFTATDDCGNTSQCNVTVVVTDDSPPTCSAMDITIMLTNNSATITGADIDNGSTDDCGGNVSAAVNITDFDCDDIGENSVILTVTDDNGNTSTCPATVTVTDDVGPICIAQGTTILLINGQATIDPEDLDNGSFDPCGEVVSLEVDPPTVDCDDVGLVFITLIITDNSGNVTTCNVPVTVIDDVDPNCSAMDITVSLDDSQMVTITGEDVDNGSTDDCGEVESLSVTPNTFECEDLGDNIVVLTVTDNSGNTSTCTAIVTVIDEVSPICMTQDITVVIDNGSVSITPEDIDDGSFDPCGEVVDLSVSPDNFDCDDIGVAIVVLTVTDMNGNSSTCTASVTVTDIVAPVCVSQDITVALDDSGTAVITGDDVDGGSTDACGEIVNLVVVPNIFVCDDLGDNVVVLTVFDDAGNSSSCTATVTVIDEISPVCMTQDITVTIDNGSVTITPEDVDDGSFDPCGEIVELTVTPDMFDCDDIGIAIVVLTVTDMNGNSSTCTAQVTVTDIVAPVCVSQDITVVLDETETATITGEDVDGGSTDACGEIVDFQVDPNEFDCDDLGDNEVVLTVTDDSGNTSSCTAIVTVQDTMMPICISQDITVELDVNGEVTITAEDVDNGSMAVCDQSVELEINIDQFFCNDIGDNVVILTVTDMQGNTSECTATVTVLDNLPPAITCPGDTIIACDSPLDDLTIYGEATAVDNCDGDVEIEEVVLQDLNVCDVGEIVRTFTATDNEGNTSQCVQIITVGLDGDFIMESDITWPADTIVIADCTTIDPDSLEMGVPEVDTSMAVCFILTVNFDDNNQTPGGECMDTILRTWTIIDSCQFDGDGNGEFVFEQVLIINDTVPPIIIGPMDTIVFADSNCVNFVELPAVITDCSMDIIATNDSPFADDNDSGDATGTYELGLTTVTITADDGCGNVSMYSYTVEVVDTTPPVLECIKIFPEITDDGTVDINVNDAIGTLSDNCTDSIDIIVGFITQDEFENGPITVDPADSIMTFDCDSLGLDVPIWIGVEDESGNISACRGLVTVLDPGGFCIGSITQGEVSGIIFTEQHNMISQVQVSLSESEMPDEYTNTEGYYSFPPMPVTNVYEVAPLKDDNPLDGVSTLDLIFIQRHVLGMEILDSPYKIVAADINNSASVTVRDVLELRKLLLGVYEDFPENTSWKMIDADYNFPDPTDPFIEDYPLSSEVQIVGHNNVADFIGVKIGDVNGSNEYDQLNSSETRDGVEDLVFEITQYQDNIGGKLKLDFKSSNFNIIDGFQFTLKFDQHQLTYEGLQSSEIEMNEGNLGLINREDGYVTVSWNDVVSITKESDDILFSLVFEINDENTTAEIDINSDKLRSEAYRNGKSVDILYEINDLNGLIPFTLFQNAPNPWNDHTSIKFNLDSGNEVLIRIMDMTGRLIWSHKGEYGKGLNEISLSSSDLSGTGVFFVEMTVDEISKRNRMIMLK